MNKLASNPYCVWFQCKMRTFKTLAAAEAFARRNSGRIGVWSDAEGWWVERAAQRVSPSYRFSDWPGDRDIGGEG